MIFSLEKFNNKIENMINPKKQEYYVKLYKMIAYRLFAAK